MDIQLVDVTIHIDEELDTARRQSVEQSLRTLDGVVSVHNPDHAPHLTIVQYDRQVMDSVRLLESVRSQGVNAELVGI